MVQEATVVWGYHHIWKMVYQDVAGHQCRLARSSRLTVVVE
jgi:hypothetical protein